MSSITSLISAGGGVASETHIKTDPSHLTRVAAKVGKIKSSNNAVSDTTQSAFFTSVNAIGMGATVTVAASNTYVNLLNITSAANGGYLHWILLPAVSATNATSTVRITVDGNAPYEFAYDYASVNDYARMIIGGGHHVASLSTTTVPTEAFNVWNPQDTFGVSTENPYATAGYYDSTNNVYGTGQQAAFFVSDFSILRNMTYEKLRFESSLLIEVKQTTLYTTTQGEKAACIYILQ